MANIQIDPDVVEASAGKIQNLGSNVDKLFQQIKSEIDSLDPIWAGQSEDRFKNKWNGEIYPALQKINPFLTEMSQALRTIAQNFRQADQSLQA